MFILNSNNMVFLHGHMEEYIKVFIKTTNSMDIVDIEIRMERKSMDFGGMMLEKDGSLHISAKIYISLLIFNH